MALQAPRGGGNQVLAGKGLSVGPSEHVSPMALDEGLALTLCSCDTVWKEAAFLRFSLVPGL